MPATHAATIDRTFPVKPAKRPLLRLTTPGTGQYLWIHKGKQGSLQTAYQMARLVREDVVRDEGLQIFAARLLINNGLDSHSNKAAVATCLYEYVQKQIKYIHDPAGSFDSVSSARQTLSKGFGDCDDKAVLLATLLALVGQEPRFVLAKYKAGKNGFDHVYNDVLLRDGRFALDSCSDKGAGWESPRFYERLTYPIFAFPTTSLGEAMNLVTTGASIGVGLIPGVGPLLTTLVGPIASLFSRKQQRAEETARDEYKDNLLRAMEQIEAKVNSCGGVTREQGAAAAKELVRQFYSACDQFTKKSVATSCRNFETQDIPGGAQEGAIRTHLAHIEAAGGNCALNRGQGADGGGALMSASVGGFPIWLLVAGGVGVYLMMRR